MDNWNQMNQYSFDSSYAPGLTLNQYIARTYAWMFVGLTITFLLAWAMSASGAVFTLLIAFPQIAMILLIAELAVVLIFSARIHKNSVGVSRVLFVIYSVLNGVVFSVIFVVFEVTSLIAIFGLTALFFGGFALYGRFTKTDLYRLRPLLIVGLIFLLVAGVLSLFIDMTAMERLICMAGIVIFLCCTAYDNQKIKANYQFFYHDAVMLQKASIYSALQLYLDFLNLFLYLLRFLGRSKN